MSKINKLTTSFIKITNALDKVKNQDEYNIYVSMLDEEELECLKYAQRLRKYTNRQMLAASPTDTDESKPEKKKRGRKNKVVADDELCRIRSHQTIRPSHHPPLDFYYCLIWHLPYESMLVYFELLAHHIVGVVVLL